MPRKKIKECVSTISVDLFTTKTVEECINILKDIVKNINGKGYSNTTVIHDHHCYECSGGEFEFFADRDETEEERTRRLKSEGRARQLKKERQEKARAKRLEQYKKLQKELG